MHLASHAVLMELEELAPQRPQVLACNRLFQILDLHWRAPESGDLWYKSRRSKKRVDPTLRVLVPLREIALQRPQVHAFRFCLLEGTKGGRERGREERKGYSGCRLI